MNTTTRPGITRQQAEHWLRANAAASPQAATMLARLDRHGLNATQWLLAVDMCRQATRSEPGYPVDVGGPTCPQHGAPLGLAHVGSHATLWACPAGDIWERPDGGYLYPPSDALAATRARHCAQAQAGYYYCGQPGDPCGPGPYPHDGHAPGQRGPC